MKMKTYKPTTGIAEADKLVGEILVGDNVVWEADSGAPLGRFVSGFISACEKAEASMVYVSFNRSPQAIAGEYAKLMTAKRFTLVDCFSSGKGDGDKMFFEFFDKNICPAIHVQSPSDPVALQGVLEQAGVQGCMGYVFDSLTGMLDLWGDEDKVIRFFGHYCPRLFDLNTIAYWLLETDAHSSLFLAKIRHITQVVFDVSVSGGINTLTVKKAVNRSNSEIGVPQRFVVDGDNVRIMAESREGKELALLTKMGQILASALSPASFFEGVMRILAEELGMIRGTLVLLDGTSGKLKIVAAHGLTNEEKVRGEYAVGEGVTGIVVKSGVPEIVPDIRRDERFLDRTVTRKREYADPTAFICVPIRVDDEVMGALSADRPFAVEHALSKDLRLLSIVGTIISQVIKINRMVHIEKEQILARNENHLQELRLRYRLDNVVGESEPMRMAIATAATAAKSRAAVLITGETGTGKELAANIVHYNSPRANGPFVKVNCGALPDTLLESELFGHVKGAFTGAVRDHKGRFAMADGGTIFLDEVGDMSSHLQVKLLRVLQERQFEPLGSTHTVEIDVRVVAATSKDLKEEMIHGRFRQDLYYRLNVIPIHLPPLRERCADIPLLVNHFLMKFNRENNRKVSKLSRNVLDLLCSYSWPGNVRELENCIERAVVMSPGDSLLPSLLPQEVTERQNTHRARPVAGSMSSQQERIRDAVRQCCEASPDILDIRSRLMRTVEETIIRSALDKRCTRNDLARLLGISRMTLRKRMREYGIN